MITEILLAMVIGICAGIITGLIPGIHINLVSLLLLSSSAYLLGYTAPIILCVFIISMSVTHSFLDFIPSVFLGAPDADTALSVLPGHKMLLEGRAYDAVKLTVIGSLGALILAVAIIPILIPTVKIVYPFLKLYMGWILVVVMAFMILKDHNRIWNAAIFFVSGVLGLIVLNIPNLNNPLFPMLSGLFGVSMLTVSLAQKVNIPKQTITEDLHVKPSLIAESIASGTFAGILTSFFPGLGPAQGAVIASELTPDIGDKGFMILVGGINTVNFVLSLVTLLVLEKARNGAVIVVQKILLAITIEHLLIFVATALIVGGLAAILALNITKVFAKVMSKVNYQALVICIIVVITIMSIGFGRWLGLLILIVSTAIGIIPYEVGVGRNHAMGCLILPVILYFLL